jgi:hypothetical protein
MLTQFSDIAFACVSDSYNIWCVWRLSGLFCLTGNAQTHFELAQEATVILCINVPSHSALPAAHAHNKLANTCTGRRALSCGAERSRNKWRPVSCPSSFGRVRLMLARAAAAMDSPAFIYLCRKYWSMAEPDGVQTRASRRRWLSSACTCSATLLAPLQTQMATKCCRPSSASSKCVCVCVCVCVCERERESERERDRERVVCGHERVVYCVSLLKPGTHTHTHTHTHSLSLSHTHTRATASTASRSNGCAECLFTLRKLLHFDLAALFSLSRQPMWTCRCSACNRSQADSFPPRQVWLVH